MADSCLAVPVERMERREVFAFPALPFSTSLGIVRSRERRPALHAAGLRVGGLRYEVHRALLLGFDASQRTISC